MLLSDSAVAPFADTVAQLFSDCNRSCIRVNVLRMEIRFQGVQLCNFEGTIGGSDGVVDLIKHFASYPEQGKIEEIEPGVWLVTGPCNDAAADDDEKEDPADERMWFLWCSEKK